MQLTGKNLKLSRDKLMWTF